MNRLSLSLLTALGALVLGGCASTGGSDTNRQFAGACGRISDFDSAPRGEQLHRARVISIDGRLPGPAMADSWRVSAGRHTLVVAEAIEPQYITMNPRQRDAGGAATRHKTLEINVPPDTTVLIAARLLDQRQNPGSGDWWQPVAWREVPETCR